MATTAYCTIGDIQNRLSATGVTSRTDDTPPDDYGDVIDEASRIVDESCLLMYSEANLAASGVVKHWTANIASFLLCERRGNPVPVGIASKYERVMETLDKVLLHGRQIPDIPMRKVGAPVLSNVRVQLAPVPHTVVERSRSTGKPDGYRQRNDVLDYVNTYEI